MLYNKVLSSQKYMVNINVSMEANLVEVFYNLITINNKHYHNT